MWDVDHAKVEDVLNTAELEAVIHKMKHKAPGHDGLYIDSYKHMGPLAKQTLLDLYNIKYMREVLSLLCGSMPF